MTSGPQSEATRRAMLKQKARGYLNEREAEEAAKRSRERIDWQRQFSLDWMAEYRASGRGRSRFNWTPKLGAFNRSTTNEQEAGQASPEAKAPEVSHGEGLGDAPRQESRAGDEGGGRGAARQRDDEPGRPEREDAAAKWERDSDTPF